MKKWYESKTVWLGIVTVSVAALSQLNELPVPDSWKSGIIAAVGFLNVVLRVFSTSVQIDKGGNS